MQEESKAESLSTDQLAVIAQRESERIQQTADSIIIKNDDDLYVATEMLAKIKQTAKNVAAQKDPIVKGLNASLKNVRDLFRPAEDRLSAAERQVKQAILAYHEAVAKKAVQKAARIEKKIDAGELDVAKGMAKLSNIKQAETGVQTASGSSQVRVTRKVRIINAADLPMSYFLRPRVLEALRMEVSEDVMRKQQPCPPGAEIYEEKSVAAVSNSGVSNG